VMAAHPIRPRRGAHERPFVILEAVRALGGEKLCVMRMPPKYLNDLGAFVLGEVLPGNPGNDHVTLVVPGGNWRSQGKQDDDRQKAIHRVLREDVAGRLTASGHFRSTLMLPRVGCVSPRRILNEISTHPWEE